MVPFAFFAFAAAVLVGVSDDDAGIATATASDIDGGENGTMKRWPFVTPPLGTVTVNVTPSYIASKVYPAWRVAGAIT